MCVHRYEKTRLRAGKLMPSVLKTNLRASRRGARCKSGASRTAQCPIISPGRALATDAALRAKTAWRNQEGAKIAPASVTVHVKPVFPDVQPRTPPGFFEEPRRSFQRSSGNPGRASGPGCPGRTPAPAVTPGGNRPAQNGLRHEPLATTGRCGQSLSRLSGVRPLPVWLCS